MAIGAMFTAAVDAIEDVLVNVLHLDAEQVKALVADLEKTSDTLESQKFHHQAKIQPTSFGAGSHAESLGYHHDKAYLVIEDTLKGVAEDLMSFATNVRQTAKLMMDYDDTVAADIRQLQAVTDQLKYDARHSHADDANHESRNENLDGGGN